MLIGIVGLGLVGGSAAKAYKGNSDYTIYAAEKNETVFGFARMAGIVDGRLDEATLGQCDGLILALYPGASIDFLRKTAPLLSQKALVIDFCGVKRAVCQAGFAIAQEYGFTFVGGHPMAGTQNSGFQASRATLYNGASMLLVPPRDDIHLLERTKNMLTPLGFGQFVPTTAELHDERIAYTSQLAHVVSSAFAKSPAAQGHKGYSAGSYKDLTRVAKLNVEMWTELFLENRDYLSHEIALLIAELESYRRAIGEGDAAELAALLEEGRRRKQEAESR